MCDITSNNVKLAFSNVGLGYNSRCSYAEKAITTSCRIESVMYNTSRKQGYNHDVFVQKYLNQRWMGTGIKMSSNRPTNFIVLVPLNSFPVKSAEIKKSFLAAQQLPSVRYPGAGTFTIQHLGKADQKADAKKGVEKRMLLCLQ